MPGKCFDEEFKAAENFFSGCIQLRHNCLPNLCLADAEGHIFCPATRLIFSTVSFHESFKCLILFTLVYLLQESESEDEGLDEGDEEIEEEPEPEPEAPISADEPAERKTVPTTSAPKDTERQLSKKELKKKGLEELDALLAELGISGKDGNQEQSNGINPL